MVGREEVRWGGESECKVGLRVTCKGSLQNGGLVGMLVVGGEGVGKWHGDCILDGVGPDHRQPARRPG